MVYFILGGSLLIVALIPALLLIFGHADKHVCVGVLTATIVFGSLLIIGGHCLHAEAIETYNELLTSKNFIEQNFNSDDICTQYEAHDAYFRYMFKYEQIKNNDGIMDGYWNLNLEELKLNLEEIK